VTEGNDQDAIDWLAERTGQTRDAIEKGFEEGRLRRRFVVTEIVEAGIVGPLLLEMVVRLTGLTPDEARQLIAAEAPGAVEEPAAGDQPGSVEGDRGG
jgi:hypothetical protein